MKLKDDRMPRNVTVKDLARLAGVSPATVSRVLNGTARVSPEIRARVRNAATEAGFKIEHANKTKLIAFLLGNRDLLHPFHSRVLVGAEAFCSENNYSIIFLPFHYRSDVPWQDLHLPKILQRRDQVSGFVVAGTNSQNLFDLLASKRIPFAVLGNNVLEDWKSKEYDTVWFDDEQGAYEMTRHLQAIGHRDIWFVGNCKFTWFARVHKGYQRAMEEAGLRARQAGFDCEQEESVGYLGAKSIFTGGESATAIFAGTDVCANGVYKALRDLNVRVPEEVSVVGCDDLDAVKLYPPLTTIRVFGEQVGAHLSELVLNRIAQPDRPVQKHTIPTQLIKRESSGPPLKFAGRALGFDESSSTNA
jgi:DNA-binding LacI/PurR family transcriptional regulator